MAEVPHGYVAGEPIRDAIRASLNQQGDDEGLSVLGPLQHCAARARRSTGLRNFEFHHGGI
jgi:hypothetical protein